DEVEPVAQEIGAVNTVIVDDHGLRGYNTDVDGLIEPLRQRLGSLKDLRVAVIGAGGAARAAVWALQRDQATVTLFARDTKKGGLLGDEFGVACQPLEGASFAGYDVVINATPQSPAVAEQLSGAGLIYDLVYNPIETTLLKEAKRAGCQTLGGLPMLVAQARRQFQLWAGKESSSDLMYDAAAAALRR
ncbi:MAG TPA: hypothetical protein VK893_08570, partial [Pyrinomonadaceae bacterium]|nr:hypothetical protein [Pyrinomonadaceae bacterium]